MRWMWLAIALVGCGSTASDTQVPDDFEGVEVVYDAGAGEVVHFCEDGGDTLRQWNTWEDQTKETWQITCEWGTGDHVIVMVHQHDESPALEAGSVGVGFDFGLTLRNGEGPTTIYQTADGDDVTLTVSEWDPESGRFAGTIEGTDDVASTFVTFGVTVENHHR